MRLISLFELNCFLHFLPIREVIRETSSADPPADLPGHFVTLPIREAIRGLLLADLPRGSVWPIPTSDPRAWENREVRLADQL